MNSILFEDFHSNDFGIIFCKLSGFNFLCLFIYGSNVTQFQRIMTSINRIQITKGQPLTSVAKYNLVYSMMTSWHGNFFLPMRPCFGIFCCCWPGQAVFPNHIHAYSFKCTTGTKSAAMYKKCLFSCKFKRNFALYIFHSGPITDDE